MHLYQRLILVLAGSLLSLTNLSGCGEKTVAGPPSSSKLEESAVCIGCHDGNSTASAKRVSKTTGKLISEEWKLSGHNTQNGASCSDCHEPAPGHPNSCNRCHGGTPTGTAAVHDVTVNADAAGKCAKCHTKNGGFKSSLQAHFGDDASNPASYVSRQYEQNCRKCHNPHDTASARNYLKNWAGSAHGTTVNLPVEKGADNLDDAEYIRILARQEFDYKTLGTTLPANLALSDNNNGKSQVCVRCHTTTGYINYVKSGFKDVKPFGDPSDQSKELTNCNACHDNGNEVAYGYKLRTVPQVTSFYNFSSKNPAPSTVPPTPGSAMSGGKITGFGLTYPDVGASNMCVVCHSGRTAGILIKMADARGIELDKNQGRITNHFRGASEMLFRPTDKNGNSIGMAFEFYSSGSAKLQGYSNIAFTHDIIGTTRTNPNRVEGTQGMASDSRGYGPCIGCHLNLKDELKGSQTSHSFLPVNSDASSTFRNTFVNPSNPITTTVSKSCAACHSDNGEVEWELSGIDPATGETYQLLELQRQQYKAAVKAFARLMAFAVDSRLPTAADMATPRTPSNTSTRNNRVWADSEGRPGTPATVTYKDATTGKTVLKDLANWYGSNSGGGIRLQPWLRTATSNGGAKPTATLVDGSSFTSNLDYYVLGARFTDPLNGNNYPLRNASYTMGAVYNFFMFYYDPGAFAHNRRYAKRVIFDSMDWLDDGRLNKSVCNPKTNLSKYPTGTFTGLNEYELIGENDRFRYSTYLTDKERFQAGYYLCNSIDPGDHRPRAK